MIEGGGNNGFLEIGEIIHEKSIPKANCIVKISSNRGDNLTFKLMDFEKKTVYKLKKKLFRKYLEGKKIQKKIKN